MREGESTYWSRGSIGIGSGGITRTTKDKSVSSGSSSGSGSGIIVIIIWSSKYKTNGIAGCRSRGG